MNKRKETSIDEVRMLTASQLATYTNLGIATARSIGTRSGAKVKFGTTARYDKEVIDQYLTSLHKGQ